MEDIKEINFIDIDKNQVKHKIKENFKNKDLIQLFPNLILNQGYSKIINFILFEIIFISLFKKSFSYQHYTDIKVNKIGYNQILSDEYNSNLPLNILVNGVSTTIPDKKVYIESIDYTIRLIWNDYISDLSFMFCNLENITYVNMYYMFGNNCNMSYMFYNCFNLINFDYTSEYSISNIIIDMRSMFYNCSVLSSFYFKNLYIDYYSRVEKSEKVGNETKYYYVRYYYNVNLSYMFYDCNNLESISFDSHELLFINDMKGMFYNCFSLKSLNLTNIKTNNFIDTSYMLYNCYNLTYFKNSNINIKNMKYMFYNCNSLIGININNFYKRCCYERDDVSCSNCHYYVYDPVERSTYSSIPSLNMTRIFYNCYNLKNINGHFNDFYISDTREMFYNCTSIENIYFEPIKINNYTNMSKMFYNCSNLKYLNITSSGSDNYYSPIDLNQTFFNCISLINLEIVHLKTDIVRNISYMFYNCKQLKFLSLYNSTFSNTLITDMRGMFENCESLISLNLSLFYTPKVEIMWNMFKNCKSLKYLDLSTFDTSKVTDMESMFEGCEGLISLSLVKFNTTNVRYMNKMFKNCKSLQSLYFNNINSTSLGSMQQMFYNCEKLEYLNIYSLTEKSQSFSEIFEGASDNFIVCVKDNENIPNIFEEILKRSGTQRDCSENCYGIGNSRPYIIEKKICCPKFEYNGACYNKCPKRTEAKNDDKICKYFNCSPLYYDYNQSTCISSIPNGYFVNDSEINTIDKCHKTCRTCSQAPSPTKHYCITCNSPSYQFFYFNNCLEECDNGYYLDSEIKKCKCEKKECNICTEKSLEKDLCVTCNDNYYKKSDESPDEDNYIKCYKDPPKYYLDINNHIYKPCYSSCQECYGEGNYDIHNCLICASNCSFAISNNLNGYESKNCYPNCSYYYYFDNINQYHCTETDECPQDYNYLIVELRQCVQACNVVPGYNKILRYECYRECPPIISIQSEENPNKCKSQCTFDYPFLLILKDKCVANCTIIERSLKLCITSYFENRTNLEIQELIHNDINRDLVDKFDYTIITENNTVLIEENQTVYEIVTTRNKNPNHNTTKIILGECEDRLKEYYGIDQDEYLYMLVIDAYVEGKTGPMPLYEVYYPLFNSPYLFQLDLSICDGLKINMLYNMELENPELYDKDNPIYNDMCYPYSSKDGVDMILTDVQKEYIDNNRIICDEGCKFEYIDDSVECYCEVKTTFPPLSEIKIDKDKLYKFANIKNVANFGVLKCLNLLFVKDRMITNIGIYSFLPTVISYIVCIVVFIKVDFKIIKDKIKDLLYAILNLKYIKNKKEKKEENELGQEKKQYNKKKQKPEIKQEMPNEPIIIKNYNFVEPIFVSLAKKKDFEIPNVIMKEINYMNIKNTNRIKKNLLNNSKHYYSSERKNTEDLTKSQASLNIKSDRDIIIKNIKHPPIKKPNHNNKMINKMKSSEKNDSKKSKDELNSIKPKTNKKLSEKEEKRIKEILAYNDKELNDLDFKLALKYDNRNLFKIYYSFLNTDHMLIKIFYSKDYNSRFIKIFLFFYNFSLSYTVNALFFNEDTIHQILEDEGKYNFIYQLPQILYSTIISYLLGMILDYLALSEDNILELKAERIPKKAVQKSKELLRTLKIKFIIFFIISFIFLLFFWYYVIFFCAVYINTQFHLIKDSVIGFGTGLLTPFGTKLIPLIFRIIGLKGKVKYFFFISKLVQIYL